MKDFIKKIFGRRNEIDLFIEHLLDLEKETPNNYQLGSLLRDKLRNYRRGKIDLEIKKKYFSH